MIFWFIESSLVIKQENMKNYFFIFKLTRASKKYLSDIYIQVYVMDYNYVFYQNIKMTDESLITNKNRWENQKLQTLDLKVLFWLFYLKYFAFNRFILPGCLSVDKNTNTFYNFSTSFWFPKKDRIAWCQSVCSLSAQNIIKISRNWRNIQSRWKIIRNIFHKNVIIQILLSSTPQATLPLEYWLSTSTC